MINYCTLFDINYLYRGLALYSSIKSFINNFNMYILAFDDETLKVLSKLKLENVVVISLLEFEDENLLKIKSERTRQEYCWTCSSSIIKYCIEKYKLDECTYLDSDIFFYSDPSQFHNQIKDFDVLLTEHNFTPEYDVSKTSGKYCVQYITFRSNPNGMKVLNWWRDKCLEWCYARYEDGKFGDQLYLDDWTERFENIKVSSIHGGGLAPWNIQKYYILKDNNLLKCIDKISNKEEVAVFYHFHGLKLNNELGWKTDNHYEISNQIFKNIYSPYLIELLRWKDILNSKNIYINVGIPVIPSKIEPKDLNILLDNVSELKFFNKIMLDKDFECNDLLENQYNLISEYRYKKLNTELNEKIILLEAKLMKYSSIKKIVKNLIEILKNKILFFRN
jgi:hypothetical protein